MTVVVLTTGDAEKNSAAGHKKGEDMEYNSIVYWIWVLFIGGLIGWLTGFITNSRGAGLFGDIVIGIVGAMLGGWMAKVIEISVSSSVCVFLLALAGAAVLVSLTRVGKRIVG